MNAIVAVDSHWGIGNKGQLLIRIPADMKMFRRETLGKVVVLGRKTMETFPGGRPLPDRTNIVLSANPSYHVKDCIVATNIDELQNLLSAYATEDIYVIGGASVYRQLLPFIDTVHVTKIDREYEADAYFPNLDELPEWEITASSEEQVYYDTTYNFLRYQRIRK